MTRGVGLDAQCRLILRDWRANPTFDFPPPYARFGKALVTLAADPANARLVDGVVVRIGRGDDPGSIESWASGFAGRRGLNWPAVPW